jgi:hypothetical protein
MRFKLESVGNTYDKANMEKLRELGFSFHPRMVRVSRGKHVEVYDKEEPVEDLEMEIGSVEDLVALTGKVGSSVIVEKDEGETMPTVTIFDDYL